MEILLATGNTVTRAGDLDRFKTVQDALMVSANTALLLTAVQALGKGDKDAEAACRGPVTRVTTRGQLSCIKHCLDVGARVDDGVGAGETGGETAMMIAVKAGQLGVLKLMLEYADNVNLNVTTASGKTALIFALQSNCDFAAWCHWQT